MKNWYLVRDGELVSTHMFKAFATKSALDGDLVLTRDEFAKKYGNWYVLHIVGLGITINSKHLTEKEAQDAIPTSSRSWESYQVMSRSEWISRQRRVALRI